MPTDQTNRPRAGDGLKSSDVVDGALQLVLGNTLTAIEAGRVEVRRWLEPLALSGKVTNRLEVIFEELVSNIVRHGFAPGADQTMIVTLSTTPDFVILRFEDEGRPFDPLAVPQPDRLTSLETAKIGGLGLPLVRKFAVSLVYEPIAIGSVRLNLRGETFEPRNRLTVGVARTA